jgi:hypothetical protein
MSFCFTTSILLRCCGVSLLHIIEVALAVEGLLSLLLPFNCSAFDCIGRGYCSEPTREFFFKGAMPSDCSCLAYPSCIAT